MLPGRGLNTGGEHGEGVPGAERGGEGKRGATGAALFPKHPKRDAGVAATVRPLGRGGCEVCSPRSRIAEPEC